MNRLPSNDSQNDIYHRDVAACGRSFSLDTKTTCTV